MRFYRGMTKRAPRRVEMHHQIGVAQYLRSRGVFFTISPAGIKLPMGVAQNLKMMGYRRGTHDLLVFEPRGSYHGLFVEMKTPAGPDQRKGTVTDEQVDFAKEAEKRGYLTQVCYGGHDAIAFIEKYLAGVFTK